jgi:hypothetical protein
MPSIAPFTKDNNILEILYDFNFGISCIIMYHSLSTSSNIAQCLCSKYYDQHHLMLVLAPFVLEMSLLMGSDWFLKIRGMYFNFNIIR